MPGEGGSGGVIVHHLAHSRSQRVLWLLEELGLPYEVRRYERDRRTMLAPPELARVHPLGKSPMIEDDGRVLIETGAIVEHLTDKAGRLGRPADPDGAIRWRQFLHYAEGSLMPPLLAILVIRKIGPLGWVARPMLLRMFAEHLRWLDGELAERPWFAGEDFTAADVMMSFPLEFARKLAGLDDRFPRLQAWLARVQARPAYRTALERGGSYEYL